MTEVFSGGIASVAPHIPIIKDLYHWVQGYLKGKDAKNRLLVGLSSEIELLDESNSVLEKHSMDVGILLESIEKEVNRVKILKLLEYVSKYIGIYADTIQRYIDFSIAITETVVNQDLMSSLREFDGVLFDYLERVNDTVNVDESITINAELLRFFKINQKKYFPALSKKDEKKITDLGIQYLSICKKKVTPNIAVYVNKNRKTRRRIKQLYNNNLEKLVAVQSKVKYDIPLNSFSQYLPDNLKVLEVIIEEGKRINTLID